MAHSLKDIKSLTAPFMGLATELGLELDEYEPMEVSGGSDNYVTITVRVKLDDTKGIPEEVLAYYSPKDHDLERMIRKGNTDKRTTAGATYEVALREYLTAELMKHPEYPGNYVYAANLAKEEFFAYQDKCREVWDEVCKTNKMYINDLEQNFD